MALGFFDGVHIGHAALLNRTKERAAELGVVPSVLTFDVHPDNLVLGSEVQLINSPLSREAIIRRNFGIDNVVFIHFSRRIMMMPWREFLDELLLQFDVCHIVCGYDFSFGFRGEGKPELLKSWCESNNIGCDIIPAVKLDGVTVSSTYIRKLISDGDMEKAARFLGHPHTLADTVHSGYHLGTRMGAPTINMYFPEGVIIPRHGVVGIVDAVCRRLITDIDGIVARLRNIGLVGYLTVFGLAMRSLGHANSTGCKRILAIGIRSVVLGKAWQRGLLPWVTVARLNIGDESAVVIVVDNHLVTLPVALTRREHVGAGMLEHRYKKRYDDGLRKQILACGKKIGPLPLPSAVLQAEIASVTGPDGDVAVLQAAGHLVRLGNVADPGLAVVVNVSPRLCLSMGQHQHQQE